MPLIQEALKYYGNRTAEINISKQFEYTEGTILPECCILGVQLPGYGHWSLYYQGKYYYPEFVIYG
jgi:hypothetical protein